MDLLSSLADLEDNADLHIARILILLNSFSGKDGTGTIDGLTKLAKLDFLLRYPVYLERALGAKSKDPAQLDIKAYERKSVESSMVRYRYGPWDFRYRTFINLLVAKGLVWTNVQGRTIQIGLTENGLHISSQLRDDPDFEDLKRRSKIIRSNFNIGATSLMKFIYETFPEIISLRSGKEIR